MSHRPFGSARLTERTARGHALSGRHSPVRVSAGDRGGCSGSMILFGETSLGESMCTTRRTTAPAARCSFDTLSMWTRPACGPYGAVRLARRCGATRLYAWGEEMWQLPKVHNITGKWYGPDGQPCSRDEAMSSQARCVPLALAEDFEGDPVAGVLTRYLPFDLLPAHDPKIPHIYVTYERYRLNRFMRPPRVHLDYLHFAQTRTAALAAHDQAVIHVRAEVARNAVWWRHIHIPRRFWIAFLGIGALQWTMTLIYSLYLAVGRLFAWMQ